MWRLTFLAASLWLAAAAFATQPTQAWRRIFNTGTYDDFAGAIEVDASGNAYLEYEDVQPAHSYIHVVKVGPTSGVYFDQVSNLDLFPNLKPCGIYVSPIIPGKQYVYAAFADTSSNSQELVLYKLDTSGTVVGSFSYQAQGSLPIGIAGIYFDSAGNVLLAMKRPDGNNGNLDMLTLDPSGNITSEHFNATIYPSSAIYSTVLNGWIAAGSDMASSIPQNSARWGLFDPATGLEGALGDTAEGAFNPSPYYSYAEQFVLNGLPNNGFSIIHNSIDRPSINVPISAYTSMQAFSSNGTSTWHYPSSGNRSGNVFQLASLNAAAPIFDLGIPFYGARTMIEQFNGSGVLQWQHRTQPADTMFLCADGFFTTYDNHASTNTVFLEHADTNGVYDFGKSYQGTLSGGVTTLAGLRVFQNSAYVLMIVDNSGTGKDVVLDRFVTGTAMQSITSASTVQSGHTLTATISLNGVAPTGGVSVGVSTSSNKLLLPNGTQGQFVTVPAGQSSVTVNLNAQVVASNTAVRILALQNGIRRFVDVEVTP